MNLGTLLPRHARYRPDHVALVLDEHRLTWRDLDTRVNRLANALLRDGLRKGDKIATVLPNGLELVEIYLAAAKTGMVVVPASPLLQAAGLTTLLDNSDSAMVVSTSAFADTLDSIRGKLSRIRDDRFVLVDRAASRGFRRYADLVAEAPEIEPPDADITDSDPYNIIYSSGTTGEPKGIVHTHYVRCLYGHVCGTAFRVTPESVMLHAGSLVFNGAFITLMPWLMLGATYIVHRAFDADHVIEEIERSRVTHIVMVPSQIVAMLGSRAFAPERLGSLEMLQSVGAPLHLEVKRTIHELLPGKFYELYGLTEGFVTILDKHDVARKMASVGCPPSLYEMRILDDEHREVPPGQVGEICGRGPLLMAGYYRRPDLTAKAIVGGWLHSGDLGYVDEDGFLYLVDRKKDMIISGGVNVYPRDIEEIVVQHPAVRETAVFGVQDPKWGETPVAAVVLREPGACSAGELRDWVNARVAAKFQRVHEVWLLDDLPRNIAGKTLKRVLVEHYAAARGERSPG
jgi:acyl-CoA synthetase (AMP-forming)/AMP-acid ligase II